MDRLLLSLLGEWSRALGEGLFLGGEDPEGGDFLFLGGVLEVEAMGGVEAVGAGVASLSFAGVLGRPENGKCVFRCVKRVQQWPKIHQK